LTFWQELASQHPTKTVWSFWHPTSHLLGGRHVPNAISSSRLPQDFLSGARSVICWRKTALRWGEARLVTAMK
jgi:hypothetical protein